MEPTTPTGLSSALTGVQSELTSAIGEALPIAGAVFAAIAGIMLGFKFFKKITGARS